MAGAEGRRISGEGSPRQPAVPDHSEPQLLLQEETALECGMSGWYLAPGPPSRSATCDLSSQQIGGLEDRDLDDAITTQ